MLKPDPDQSDELETSEISVVDKAAADNQVEMLSAMLQAVNAHLAATLADLEVAKSDLQGLIEVTRVAAVFVDRDLLIRRFTDPVTRIYRLGPSDIGRPLSEISSTLLYRELEADFGRMSETGGLLEKQLDSSDGKSRYTMRMTPCRRNDGSLEGATISFDRVGA